MKLKDFLLAAAFSFSLSPVTALAVASNIEDGEVGDGSGAAATEAMGDKDVVGVAIAHGDFSTFVLAVKAAGLEEVLRGEGPYTILAPSNAAFAAIPREQFDALREDHDTLADLLKHHVIKGELSAKQLAERKEVEMMDGATLPIMHKGGVLSIDGIKVLASDIEASNGVLHAIEQVLIPEAVGKRLEQIMNEEDSAAQGN
ncbi:fasciclin domain-containing protein [Allohahella marinimesophila]|uniref:FAS1 domain-containing protein n=1 Tax=Allohahella marinimesophila TaxID=1054972 RepID=A0ABP7NL02_9GAMM